MSLVAARVTHFLAVADAGSFSRAAAKLGISQAPLSQSIQRLERELGTALFERTPKGVRLTPSGEAFLPDARVTVAAAARARLAVGASAPSRRPVRVGLILHVLGEPLRMLLEVAREQDIAVRLVEGSTVDNLEQLSDGRLDLAFLVQPFAVPPRLEVGGVWTQPLLAVLPSDAPEAQEPYAPPAFVAERLILFPRSEEPAIYDAALAMFAARGLPVNIVMEPGRMLTTLSLVAAGVGCAVVPPAISNNLAFTGVAFRPFHPSLHAPEWTIATAYFPAPAGAPVTRLIGALRDRFAPRSEAAAR